ncbi:MAG: hypothetical protein ACI4BD_00370 [Paludibacteraceae bacterium]
MAKVTWQAPVATVKGKIGEKSRIIYRQKTIRDEQGRILQVLPQEAFVVEHPRNWETHPASEAEKQRMNRWRQACRQAKIILADEEQKAQWRQRFEAQLREPDPQAPVNPSTRARKSYTKLDCFIRAIIFHTNP